MIDPVLIRFGSSGLSIRWYGLMVGCGILAGYMLAHFRCQKYQISQEQLSDLILRAVFGGILGARILYVIRFWRESFAQDIPSIFKIWEGGLVFLGGFAGALLWIYLYCRRKKLHWGDVGDLLSPSLLLGEAFGRIGCLLNGCCYGFPYEGPGCFYYPHHPAGTFPLQLCSSLAALLGMAILLLCEKKNWFKGRLFFFYLVLYSIGRFCLEFGRGDYPDYQLSWGIFTPAQMTCLWLFPIGLLLLFWKKYFFRRQK